MDIETEHNGKKAKAYEMVAEQMLQQITAGVLRPGDRLPSERALAERFGVSRPTVREAMRYLEFIGCVETRLGAGSYVKAPRTEQFAPPVSSPLVPEKVRNRDLIELRLILETEVASLAAQRRTPEQLHAMRENLEQMKADIQAGGDGSDYDTQFHSLMGKATNNTALSSLVDMCYEVFFYIIKLSQNVAGMPHTAIYQHQELIDAIEAQDIPRVRLLIKQHLLRTQYRMEE